MLAFLLGQTMAWVYMITHSGLSYSRSFVSSLVVTPMVVTVVMNVLTNNIITAFGLMAVFAIVRFRNILRDTLDTSYVLISIVVGMACGTQKFSTAVIGVVMVACILLYLWYTSFGSRHRYDLILNLQWSRPVEELEELRGLLDRHSRRIQLASQRTHEGYQAVDVSYRLLMRDSARAGELVTELQELPGVAHITTMEAEDESEL
jgi:ABC-type Fe3+ transport system permease subunit